MPGHAGLDANELTDGYAKEATAEAIELGVRPISVHLKAMKEMAMCKLSLFTVFPF